MMRVKWLVIVLFGTLCCFGLFVACEGETPSGPTVKIDGDNNDVNIEDGEGDIESCPECPEEECVHPTVVKSCETSVGENPGGCHGGITPEGEAPEIIPCI
jgi:hypothetical protein